MKVFAVKDKRTNAYRQPMYFEHVVDCCRVLENITNNPESDLSKWPIDFQLDEIGSFDQKTGKHENMEPKEILQILDLKKHESRVTVDPVEEIRRNGNVN